MPDVAVEVGSTANNYQILARLATGGMAEIFLARGVSAAGVERYCVLKRILRNRASDVELVRMFLDEARLAAQLQHPNVAQVYDIGKLGDSYFFTMEYVHGETVRAILHRARSLRRELPLGAVLTVIAGAAAGLHHAHERNGMDGRPLGIVHRDVSPSNLMVSFEGSVKVVDFGVAKAADRAVETRSGTVKGKISYLSPEQCRGMPIDRRGDLFSLGIVMWEMLTTERLFRRNSDFENMTAIVNEPTPPPSSRRLGVPRELDAITLRLLAKDPNQRFQTADQVVETLEDAAARTGAMISPGGLGRLLREIFGLRPEPWLELETQDVPEGVTVTSEPIPRELSISSESVLDLKLTKVPHLGGVPERPTPSIDSGPAPFPSHQLTSPRMLQPSEGYPTLPVPTVLPLGAATTPQPPGRPGSTSNPPPLAFARAEPNPEFVKTMDLRNPSGSAHAITPSANQTILGTGPRQAPPVSVVNYPRYEPERVAPAPVERPPERARLPWLMMAIVAAAALIGSITVFVVMGDGTDEHKSPPVEEPRSIEEVATATMTPASTPTSTIESGAAVPADAAVAAVAPPDAAMPPTLPEQVVITDDPPTREKRSTPSPKKHPIEAAFADGRYNDVLARCVKNVDGKLVQCTFAACKLKKDETRAKLWYARIPSGEKKKGLLAACRNAGFDLAPAKKPDPPVDPCISDPMACQH